jgi:type II secretory pathway component GspD/PulD (secretin)
LRIIVAFLAIATIASGGQSVFHAVVKGRFKQAYGLWANRAAVKRAAMAKTLAPVPHPLVTAVAGSEPTDDGGDVHNDAWEGTVITSISDRDVAAARQWAPPMRLKPFTGGNRSFHLRGDVKTLYAAVAHEFGYKAVLDRDLVNAPSTTLRFDIDNENYEDALHMLEAATNTFIVPVSETVLFAATDSQQKRREYEPAAEEAFLIPQRSTVQEAQELLQAVQQSLEIRQAVLDPGKRMMLLRGPYSRVRIAGAILQQLLGYKPQVAIEIELITFDKSKSRSWGLGLMTTSNLVNFGASPTPGVTWENPSSISNFLTFGGGTTFLGIGFTGATIFANATEGEATSLMRSSITVVDGQAATFHVGDKYPIPSQQFSGVTPGIGSIPSMTFEDLGIVLKITPAIHSIEEVSLDLSAEFKALGTTTSNGIPSITDKKLEAKVRVNTADWVVVAGLVSRTDAVTLGGIPGLMTLPVIGGLFRSNTKMTDFSEALILIKTTVLSMPPADGKITKDLWVGSDTRWRTVL